ncbi:hypothetical protein [Streptomyces sp. NPDC054887]
MNDDQELAGGHDAPPAPPDRDPSVEGVSEAWSGAITSVRRQLARVHDGLPPLEEEPDAPATTA